MTSANALRKSWKGSSITFRRVPLPQEAAGESAAVGLLFYHPRSGHLWVSYRDVSLVVLDARRGGRLVSPRRQLPGVARIYQPDGTPAGVWVSFMFNHHRDPATGREWLSPPGVARLGLAGPARQYVQTPFVLMPVPGTVPLRLFSASAYYELGTGGRLRELRRWLPTGREDNFTPCFTHADSVCEWVSQHHYLRLTLRGPRAGQAVADSLRLPDDTPNCHSFRVYQDACGAQWCYSHAWRGVYKRRAAAPQVVQALLLAGGRNAPSARGIARLADGRLLLGTYGGPFAQAADSPQAPLRPLPFSRPGPHPLLMAYDVLTTRARPATTVVAEEDVGFSVLDPRTGNCPLLALAPGTRHRPTWFLTLCEDRQRRLWGGTDSGLFVLDLRQRQARRYQPPGPARQPLPLLNILDLAADPAADCLWLATRQGLYCLAPATGALRRVAGPTATRHPPTDDLLCVAAAGPGRVWVGTRTQGLLLVDAQRGLLRQLATADGLPSATVGTVLCRPDGVVWAGTFAGLVRYDPARQRLAVFGKAAGLNEPELNRNAAYAAPRTGALLFGGVGGLYRLASTTMGEAEADRQRPVRLLVTAYGESVGAEADEAPTPLRFLPGGAPVPALRLGARPTDFVELRLALTDLLTADLTHYTYRLRPAAAGTAPLPAWQPTTRRLVLQGLTPGDYTLEIRAETGGGQLAANMVQVPLHVARVWWQHPLVALLAALALVGLAYGLFWLQGRRARRDALRDARLRDVAANLHDKVGGLLTKISLMAEVLHNTDHEMAEAAAARPVVVGTDPALHQLAARLLLNSRAAVQALRDVVWSIDSRADSVQALLDRMEDHLDQTATVAGFVHRFEADPLPELQALRPLVRKHPSTSCSRRP